MNWIYSDIQLKWYDHVQRMGGDRLSKQILQWTLPECKKREHSRKAWDKEIKKNHVKEREN